jgi:hypothetical protein
MGEEKLPTKNEITMDQSKEIKFRMYLKCCQRKIMVKLQLQNLLNHPSKVKDK